MEDAKCTVRLADQKELYLTGVKEILTFQETEAAVETLGGLLQITGEGLHMEKLDPEAGLAILTGRVISLYYPEREGPAQKGLFSRWLK